MTKRFYNKEEICTPLLFDATRIFINGGNFAFLSLGKNVRFFYPVEQKIHEKVKPFSFTKHGLLKKKKLN